MSFTSNSSVLLAYVANNDTNHLLTTTTLDGIHWSAVGDPDHPVQVPAGQVVLRDRADRSGSSRGSGVPAVGGPGGADEASGDDYGVGQCDEGVDDAGMSFGADGELLNPRLCHELVRSTTPSGAGLQGEALEADHVVAAELVKQVAGLVAVVASIQVHRDLVGQGRAQALVEADQLGQGRAQQRRVVAVGRGGHAPRAIDQQGAFRAEFASVDG